MLGYVITALVSFMVGVILTCVALCKKNLETYKQIEQNVGNSASANWEAAKAVYNAQINGEYDSEASDESEDGEPVDDEQDAEEDSE